MAGMPHYHLATTALSFFIVYGQDRVIPSENNVAFLSRTHLG